MGFFFGVLLGVVIGAVVIYFAMARQVSNQEAAIRNLRGKLTQADADRDRRIKVATDRLQQDYDARLKAAQGLQQKLQETEAERDRLQRDYAAHLKAAHADAAQQTQQKLAEAEAEHNRRLQTETERLRQDYEARLAAAQAAEPLMSTVPTIADPPKPVTLPHSDPVEAPLPSASAALITPEAEPMIASSAEDSPPAPLASSRSTAMKPSAATTAESNPSALQDVNTLTTASYAPKPEVRCQVASEIAATLPTMSAANQARWMPMLKRLTFDIDPTVRLQAVRALGKVKASRSLPLLRRALRDADPTVVAAANLAMSRFKGYSQPQPITRKPRLPKNR